MITSNEREQDQMFQLTAMRGSVNGDTHFWFVTCGLSADNFLPCNKVLFLYKTGTLLYLSPHMADRKDWFLVCSRWKKVKSCSLGVGELHVSNGTGVVPSKDKAAKAILEL